MKKNNWIIPLAISGLSIHIFNNHLFKKSKEKLQPKERQYKVYNWKFGSVSYRQLGSGSPLLLIHDTFTGTSSIEYERIIHQLSKKHEVFVIDLLGFGYSEKANITYTAYLYVQLIHDFITEIINQTHVDIITSGSSHIFALFASHQTNELVRKCIMINPTNLPKTAMNPSKKNYTLKYLLETPFIGTTLYNFLNSKYMFNYQFNIKNKMNILSPYIEQFYYNAHNEDTRIRYAFASSLCNYLNLDLKNILDKSDRCLYIINGIDRDYDVKTIEKQYTTINPSIECATIKNSSNFPHIENPYATCDTIELFLLD
jgi:pimeloyl-ACP methyl ester carboxylesterase